MSADHLPDAALHLAPELRDLDSPEETTSDCASCPMVRQPDEPEVPVRTVFHPVARCCTYHPALANFLVGRALRRRGPGEVQLRKRIALLDGVTPYVIQPTQAFYALVEKTPRGGFGQDIERLCPYWSPEGLHCTVWQDRNSVCRSWFCKHDDGKRGQDYWNAFRDLLRVIEVKLCRWLADEVPHPATTDVDAWCAYYIATAERLDAATPEELDALRDDGLTRARAHLTGSHRALRHDPLPEILGPSVTAFFDLDDDHILLDGYSHYSPSAWPRTVFTLFSVMDGQTTWSQALDHAREVLGSDVFTEASIREMYRLGLLEARVPEDLIPGVRLTGAPPSAETFLDAEHIAIDTLFEMG